MRVMWVADLLTEYEQEDITDTENRRDGAGEGSAVQRTWVPLPAPTSSSTKPPVIPMSSSSLRGHLVHRHTYAQVCTHTPKTK